MSRQRALNNRLNAALREFMADYPDTPMDTIRDAITDTRNDAVGIYAEHRETEAAQ